MSGERNNDSVLSPRPSVLSDGWLRAGWRGVVVLYRLFRFSAVSATVILPLLGAATVTSEITGYQIAGLIGVALAFHGFAYVLNDVIDLPLDRTQPLRAQSPLVQGTIHPSQALAFALFQIPLALAITASLGGDGRAYAALAASFVLMAAYNLWGKRVRFPPLTDVIQGFGWAALAFYGAAVMPGPPTALTGVLVVFEVIFIAMINGVHGSLRDLANDLRGGARSTAILLGVRPRGANGLLIPLRFACYALALQVLLIGVTMLPLVRNWFGYGPLAWWTTAGAILSLTTLALLAILTAARSTADQRALIAAGMLHLVVTLSSLIVLFALYLPRALLAVVLVVYAVPLLTNSWLYSALRRGWRVRQL